MLAQRKGDSTMTLGEKIASARKEKGMTQEMLAEQLGVTRQAVARWETGKALPGTANLFMLRELLGIPPEEAALEEKTETREPDVQEKAETAGSLTAKQTWVLIAVMAILLWLALQFVGLGAAIGLLILLFISISGLFFIAAGKSGAATAAKAAARRVLYLAAATLLAVPFMVHCFCGICKLPKYSDVERTTRCMAAIPHSCRMDAALRNNGKWCLYAAGGPAFRPGEYNRISCLPQWRDQ